MAKILIALALFVALAAAFTLPVPSRTRDINDLICRPVGCVNVGAACDSSINTNVSATTRERVCKGGDFCKVANTTSDLTGLCTSLGDVGAACTSSGDCEGELRCINKFCNRGYLPGANCKVANDCLYFADNNDLTVACNSGKCGGIAAGAKCNAVNVGQTCLPPNVCGTDGTCVAALPAGSKCGGDPHCQFATYCNNATCTARIAAGGSCNIARRSSSDQQCVLTAQCVPNAQTGADAALATCKTSFTGVTGAICIDTTDCSGGLTCLARGRDSTNMYGACGPTVASSRRACNATGGADTTTVCSANEFCLCNPNSGSGACYGNSEVANKGAKSALNNAFKCVEKCARTDYPCLAKCEGKICGYVNKIVSYTEKLDSFELKCREDDAKEQIYAGYVACSAGSFLQFSLIGFVAVVAALLL